MAAGTVLPFAPAMPAFTQNIVVTGSSQNITFAAGQGLEMDTVRLGNSGTQTVFVRWGTGAVTSASTTTDMPIFAGTVETFSKGLASWLSAIASATGSTLYVTPGESS